MALIMLMIAVAPLMIWYSPKLTSYLRMLTGFSKWTVRCCESEPGGACSCNYVAILFIFNYTTTIILLDILKIKDLKTTNRDRKKSK